MAKLGQAARVREQQKAEKEINAIQKKMELQNKKANFGEGWKKALGTERQKAMLEIIGNDGAPKLEDSIDINAFLEPIEFFRDKETGEINKIDFQTYLDAEKAFQGGIDEQNEIIADEDDVTPDIMEKINSGKKSKSKKKKEDGINVPEYLQKYYTVWMKYFGRYVPLYNKYVCTCCGRPLPQGEYYLNYNEMDLARVEPTGKMHTHLCKDCCKRLYEYLFFEKAKEVGQVAMMWFCSALNIYYDETIYLQAKQECSKKDSKKHIIDSYMSIMNQSATAKGKVFLESKDIQGMIGSGGVNGNGRQDKDKKIINSKDGSVGDDTENGWNKQDLINKRNVVSMVGYDPFYEEEEDNRKKLYAALLGMLDDAASMDGMKVNAAVQIVLGYSRLEVLNRREKNLMYGDGEISQLKAIADLKNKQLDMITKFSRDNGFGEKYQQGRSRGEGSLSGVMSKMAELKYEQGLPNRYDIETSKSIEQAANASFKAIMNQLNMSDSEYMVTIAEQLKRITELQRELSSTKEDLRLAKREIAELKLEEKAKEEGVYDGEEKWGGY